MAVPDECHNPEGRCTQKLEGDNKTSPVSKQGASNGQRGGSPAIANASHEKGKSSKAAEEASSEIEDPAV